MLYEECETYLQKNEDVVQREKMQTVLLILWHMFSELEQMHYLVRTRHFTRVEKEALIRVICAVQEDLYPIIAGENIPALREELRDQEEEISWVMAEYLKHAESLLQYRTSIPFS